MLIIKFYNWRRIALIGTDDSFAVSQQEGLENALKLESRFDQIEAERVIVPFNLQDKDIDSSDSIFQTSEYYQTVKNNLLDLKNRQFVVFMLSGIKSDVRFILRVAHDLGMIGKNYQWIGGDWGYSDIFDDWHFAQKNPEIAVGVLIMSYACNTKNPSYAQFEQDVAQYDLKPDIWKCTHYDGQMAALNAYNQYNNLFGDASNPRCLEYNHYMENTVLCGEAELDTYIKSQFYNAENKCIASEGTCRILQRLESSDATTQSQNVNTVLVDFPLHKPQVILLELLLNQKFDGLSGTVFFTDKGNRNITGLVFNLLNSKAKVESERINFYWETVREFNPRTLSLNNNADDPSLIFGSDSLLELSTTPLDDSVRVVRASYDQAMRYFWLVTSSLMILICLGCMTFFWWFKEKTVIKTSSVKLMWILLGGGIVALISIMLMTVKSYPEEYMCVAQPWVQHYGIMTCIVILGLKTWRIHRIFNHPEDRKKIKDMYLIYWLIASYVLLGIYLAIWTAVDMPYLKTETTYFDETNREFVAETFCHWNPYFFYIILSIELILVLACGILSFTVRKTPSYFNEARPINLIVVGWALLCFTFLLFSIAFKLTPTLIVSLHSAIILIPVILVVFGLCTNRIYRTYTHEHKNDTGEKVQVRKTTTSTSLSHLQSKASSAINNSALNISMEDCRVYDGPDTENNDQLI
eukprot:Awhi_evm1s12834